MAAGMWDCGAVSFLAAREITNGTVAERFSPDAKLTRGQFIVISHLQSGSASLTAWKTICSHRKRISPARDSGNIAAWAMDGMTLLIEAGIMGGPHYCDWLLAFSVAPALRLHCFESYRLSNWSKVDQFARRGHGEREVHPYDLLIFIGMEEIFAGMEAEEGGILRIVVCTSVAYNRALGD